MSFQCFSVFPNPEDVWVKEKQSERLIQDGKWGYTVHEIKSCLKHGLYTFCFVNILYIYLLLVHLKGKMY